MLADIKKEMENLMGEIKSHNDLLNSITDVLDKAIEKANDEKANLDQKVASKNNEITLLEGNIKEKEDLVKTLSSTIEELNPKIKDQDTLKADLKTTISSLEKNLDELRNSVAEAESKLSGLESEVAEKSKAKDELLASIDVKVEENKKGLNEARTVYDQLVEKYVSFDYLFEIIDTPEIEILAIISANRPVSQEKIKAQAKSVLPIMVSRAITKLEADGKIILNAEDKWDFSPALLEKL
ncbi:MAG: hypothetical protein INQ03_02970 [Candidatus Heimdallarchaeota archaeon]|nr:hypothetical protein [Candidatus Heimdallarchaeota archaeon]